MYIFYFKLHVPSVAMQKCGFIIIMWVQAERDIKELYLLSFIRIDLSAVLYFIYFSKIIKY